MGKSSVKNPDVQYIIEHGVESFLESLAFDKKVTDSNRWKDYSSDKDISLFEFCDENNISAKEISRFIDRYFPKGTVRGWVDKFCYFEDDKPETLDDTIVETVENGGYNWGDVIDYLDVLLSVEDKRKIVQNY